MRRKLPLNFLWQVVLQYGMCLDESSINVYYFCEDLIRFPTFLLYGSPAELV